MQATNVGAGLVGGGHAGALRRSNEQCATHLQLPSDFSRSPNPTPETYNGAPPEGPTTYISASDGTPELIVAEIVAHSFPGRRRRGREEGGRNINKVSQGAKLQGKKRADNKEGEEWRLHAEWRL